MTDVENRCEHNAEHLAELRERMASNDQEHESFRRRLNDHDEKMNCLIDLTCSVKSLAVSMDQTRRTVEKIDQRVEAIENEPADKWKKIAFEIVKITVAALVGAALLKLGIGN